VRNPSSFTNSPRHNLSVHVGMDPLLVLLIGRNIENSPYVALCDCFMVFFCFSTSNTVQIVERIEKNNGNNVYQTRRLLLLMLLTSSDKKKDENERATTIQKVK
jgi:hypothetical protein